MEKPTKEGLNEPEEFEMLLETFVVDEDLPKSDVELILAVMVMLNDCVNCKIDVLELIVLWVVIELVTLALALA